MTLNEFAELLLISTELAGDMVSLLELDVDYTLEVNANGIYNKYRFNKLAINKGKSYLKQLIDERDKINKAVGKLGYDITKRTYPHIWIAYGCYAYLKSKGYKDSSIAYVMNKHRTTIVTVWDRIEPLKYDLIANTVMEKTIEVLGCP